MFEIEFYQEQDGSSPVEEFLNAQDIKMQAKLFHIIELLEAQGNNLREPYSKSLGDGIFEIRAKTGSDITIILYFFVINKKIILTNGFIKKTQETPRREIKLAKSRRKDYLERQEK